MHQTWTPQGWDTEDDASTGFWEPWRLGFWCGVGVTCVVMSLAFAYLRHAA